MIGAGIIGLELGSVWRRLGAQVTVVEFLDRITPGMDAEIAKTFQRALTKQGMAFKLGSQGHRRQGRRKTGVELTVEPVAGGAAETLEADYVLLAIGRRPYTEGLGLESVGITPDKRGFIETDHWKTSAPGVWAIGDVTHGPMLAHKAEDEAVACIETIAGKAGHVNYGDHPERGLHQPRGRLGRQDRGGAEGRGPRLQGRQVPLHRQQPRQDQPRDRGLREGAGRRRHRRGAGRAHDRPVGLAR